MGHLLLRMDRILKEYPGLTAVKYVNLTVRQGEILGLIGENGAGKTTLVKIITGSLVSDYGSIFFDEKRVELRRPVDAHALGIHCIHQVSSLIPTMTVAENIYVLRKQFQRFFISRRKLMEEAVKVLEELELQIDLTQKAGELSLADQKLLEVAVSVSAGARLVIMDEPTSFLLENEVEMTLRLIKRLARNQVSVIFVSHRLNEILRVCDRIAVIRDGMSVGTFEASECTPRKLLHLMMGTLPERCSRLSPCGKAVALDMRGVSAKRLREVSLRLYEGEVLGLVGLPDAGGAELLRLLFGLEHRYSGDIFVRGKRVLLSTARKALGNGIAYLPGDRLREGIIAQMSIMENTCLCAQGRVSKAGVIKAALQRYVGAIAIREMNVRKAEPQTKMETLSAGQQQKIALYKALAVRPKILLLDEPTRGVDIIAKREILNKIQELSKEGISAMIVSNEYRELLEICHRVLFFKEGYCVADISAEELTLENALGYINEY